MKTEVNYAQLTQTLQGAISQYEQLVAGLAPVGGGNYSDQLKQTAVLNQNQGIILGLRMALGILDQFAEDDPSQS